MSDERTEPHSAGSTSGSVRDTLTISEAAAFLGVHKNTVRNRVKDGTYEAEQVVTERGPTYFDCQYLIKRVTRARYSNC